MFWSLKFVLLHFTIFVSYWSQKGRRPLFNMQNHLGVAVTLWKRGCAAGDSRVHHFEQDHEVMALLLSMSDKRNVIFSHHLTPFWHPNICFLLILLITCGSFLPVFCSLFHSPLRVSSLSHRDGWTARIDLVSERATASEADERRPFKEANWISIVCAERATGSLSLNPAKDNQT